MKSVRRALVAAFLGIALFCIAAVSAQEKPQGGPPKAEPGLEMKRANFQLGTWNVYEKHEAMEGFPGGEGKGVMKVRSGPGGLSLVTDYRSVGPMGKFHGEGFLVWDAEEKTYRSFWFDNFMAGSTSLVGQWQGEDLVLTGEAKMMGQAYKMKEVFTDITPRSFTMKMYMSDGGPMVLAFTLKATKQ